MLVIKAEIFVLNYNGRELLIECLPSILEAAQRSPVSCPVTVIDNDSRDDSVEVLKQQFPQVRVLHLKNRVLCSFNEAASLTDADVIVLLNSDLKADPDFMAPLIDVFQKNMHAFLAAPKAFTFDGAQYEGCLSKMRWRFGLPGAESRFPGYEGKIDEPSYTMQAGFGAFRREHFLKLGGYDDLYLPGTVEDMDLCYRAWKAGYQCYYVPGSRMSHKGQATFKKSFSRFRLLALNQRNLYLFVWKNVTSRRLLLNHLLWLLPRPLWFLLKGRPEFICGLIWAAGRLPEALRRRNIQKKAKTELFDRQVFSLSERI